MPDCYILSVMFTEAHGPSEKVVRKSHQQEGQPRKTEKELTTDRWRRFKTQSWPSKKIKRLLIKRLLIKRLLSKKWLNSTVQQRTFQGNWDGLFVCVCVCVCVICWDFLFTSEKVTRRRWFWKKATSYLSRNGSLAPVRIFLQGVLFVFTGIVPRVLFVVIGIVPRVLPRVILGCALLVHDFMLWRLPVPYEKKKSELPAKMALPASSVSLDPVSEPSSNEGKIGDRTTGRLTLVQ